MLKYIKASTGSYLFIYLFIYFLLITVTLQILEGLRNWQDKVYSESQIWQLSYGTIKQLPTVTS